MAPTKLTDEVLESILWNKAPIELQKEIKEITVGSVQELLHKLLKAEATVQERDRRGKERNNTTVLKRTADHRTNKFPVEKTSATQKDQGKEPVTRQGSEMSLKYAKCFNCQEKGHFAKSCPHSKKKGAHRVTVEEPRVEESIEEQPLSSEVQSSQEKDPWIRTLIVGDNNAEEQPCAKRGPTYKVDLIVDGVKTRGFMDHGAQVSLVRKELLPAIREANNWSLQESHKRNLEMGAQPVGAAGIALGTVGLVLLQVTVEGTEVCKEVPCHVLASEKPIWQGELGNCGVILGTNALLGLGFKVIHANGMEVHPQLDNGESQHTVSRTSLLQVTLGKDLHLGPWQT